MTDELTITKFVFDDWWTSTYIDRLTPLLAQEIEALVDFHWRELRATAIRHSLREQAKKDCVTVMCNTHAGGHEGDPAEGCTCGAIVWQRSGWHLVDCPLYQPAQ